MMAIEQGLHLKISEMPHWKGIYIYIILPILVTALAGQDTSVDTKDVFQSAYETAISDGTINEQEQEILNTLRKSLSLSEEDIEAIKHSIDKKTPKAIEQPIDEGKLPVLDQSGRWPLVAQNMVYAAGLYGWMVPYVLDVEDPKWYIGSEMMSLGVSFFLTYKYTKNMEISHARAQMMRAGSAVGLVYGRGVTTLLGLDFDLFAEDSDGSKLGSWILMASVPAGIYVGDKLYNRWQPSNGQSWSLTLWSEIGSWTMRALHLIIETEPRKPDKWEYEYYDETGWLHIDEEAYERDRKEYRKWEKTYRIFDMAGYPLGTYLGHRFFGNRQYTFGDAIMLMQGRSLGWLYATMLGDILEVEFEGTGGRLFRMGGTIGGTLLFDKLIKGYDYTFGQSILSVLGTVSGMSFSGGISAILEIDDITVVKVLVMAGGVTGLYLAKSILKLKPENVDEAINTGPTLSVIPIFHIQKNRQERERILFIPAMRIELNF